MLIKSIKNIVEKHPNLIPYVLISVILLMIFICAFGIGIPLYKYANNREIHQVDLARDGLNNFIHDFGESVSNTTYQLSQDSEFIKKIDDMFRKKTDGVGILRRKITEYVMYNNINYFEILDTKGVVIFDLDNDSNREGLDISKSYIYNKLTASNQINSIDIINNKIYMLSSIYVFNNSNKEAVILMGKEITYDIIKEWSKKLTTDIIPIIYQLNTNKYEFPDFKLDSSFESYINKISLDPTNMSSLFKQMGELKKSNSKINIHNNDYALSVLEMKNFDNSNVLKFYILRSLKEFSVSIKSIIIYVLLFTTPFLLMTIIAIVYLEKMLINLNIDIKHALERLKKNYEALKTSQSNLSLRIKDAHIVKILSDNLAEINDIEGLENEIISNINILINNLKIYVKYSIEGNIVVPEEILRENILWKKEVFKDLRLVSIYVCYGNIEMTERETILMETIFATANLRYNNICYIHDFVNKKLTENEIIIAKKVHRAIMPEYYPTSPFFDLKGYYEAATTLGGDFLSCYYDEETKILRAYIGDVTGHGIPSAILSTAVMAQVEAFEDDIRVKNKNYNFDDCFRRINSIVWRLGKQQFTMTFQILEADFINKKIHIFNAAHNPMLVGQINSDLKNSHKLFKPIMGTGIFLGYAAQYQNKYFTTEIELKSEMSIIMYTDGIIEALDEKDNPYSLRRMISILSNNFQMDSSAMMNACLNDYKKFTNNKDLEDDITLLILKIL